MEAERAEEVQLKIRIADLKSALDTMSVQSESRAIIAAEITSFKEKAAVLNLATKQSAKAQQETLAIINAFQHDLDIVGPGSEAGKLLVPRIAALAITT